MGFPVPTARKPRDTATLCRFMVDGRFRQEGLEETALEHILRGLKIQGVKQVEAHLEPGDGRAEALLLPVGSARRRKTPTRRAIHAALKHRTGGNPV